MSVDDEMRDDELVEEALRRVEEWKRKDPAERAEDLRSLQGEVARATASSNPMLVNATDLDQWANRRDAESTLPEMVRRLVSLAPGLNQLSGRAGDGVRLRGWDLVASASQGDPFVPLGSSAWEVSTEKGTQQKANEDFAKRTAEPLGVDPTGTTFIAVTARRWGNKDQWARDRSTDSPWREVRAYDADDLETWLQFRPSVHYWISNVLGRRPGAAQALDQWFSRWSEATDPALPAGLLTAGRGDQVKELEQWLASDIPIVTLQADSREEVAAFLASALVELEDGNEMGTLQRALVITDDAAWDQVIESSSPLLLLPLSESADIAAAIKQGHRVVIPSTHAEFARGNAIELGRLRRDTARDQLLVAGIPEGRADDLALLARRSLMALRRKLSTILQNPWWAQGANGDALSRMMLIGRWRVGVQGDEEAISRMTHLPLTEVERRLVNLAVGEDPPVTRIGSTWLVSSKEDLWLLLGRRLTIHDVEEFRLVCIEALTETDPSLELEAGQRFMAPALGLSWRHSQDLREGIADTCAFLGSRGDDLISGQLRSGELASALVDSILVWANADPSGDSWASVGSLLPLLAEAAPDRFLSQVESGLAGAHPVLALIFRDSSSAGVFNDSSPHAGLLWALESLCWEPGRLARAARALARLAAVDPGGRLSNRPAASLRNVLLVYQPHTRATFSQRIEVIDLIRGSNPSEAWTLMLDLLPGRHEWWSPTHSPRWREWRPDEVPTSTVAEVVTACEQLTERLLVDAGIDIDRWRQLIGILPDLPVGPRGALKDAIRNLPTRLEATGDQVRIWEALEDLVRKHRRFPDAQWSMSGSEVDEVVGIRDLFAAPPDVEVGGELFGHSPVLPGIEERFGPEYDTALEAARSELVRRVTSRGGLEGLRELAANADIPELIGVIVAASNVVPDRDLIGQIQEDGPLAKVAWGYTARWVEGHSWEELSEAVWADAAGWPPSAKAKLLLAAGVSNPVLALLEQQDDDVQSRYWSDLNVYRVPQEHVAAVAHALIGRGRPWSAVQLISISFSRADVPGAVSTDLVAETLEAALFGGSDEQPEPALTSHAVSMLLDSLEATSDPRAGRFEFAMLNLLQFQRTPIALQRELANNPEFYCDIVCRIYREEDADPDEVEGEERSNEDTAIARLAFTLLHSWHSLPGLKEDGSVDADSLRRWFQAAHARLVEAKRGQVAMSVLGEVLASSPDGSDGVWPCEPVRDLIEESSSEPLDQGVQIGRRNARSSSMRNPTDGGIQERALAGTYRTWAAQIDSRWPRTAEVLRSIAASYDQEARWHDESAERWMDQE
jgi:hypothetical protein